MAKFYDITTWTEKPFLNTKGTRDKCIVVNPADDCNYYFKTSIKKEDKDYKSEFWSEIIASEIGRKLGFNVLEYNIALHNDKVGCISKSMTTEAEYLLEGINILTGYDNTYKPDDKKSYSEYTFQFIENALNSFNLSNGIIHIIETIVFDALIGNSDRHQENWGFIVPYKKNDITETDRNSLLRKLIQRIKNIKANKVNSQLVTKEGIIIDVEGEYAPIYDSGCCLAREKTDPAVKQMLKDEMMLNSFINRGKSEIRWTNNGEKLNHFELIGKIKEKHKEIVDKTIERTIKQYNADIVKQIVTDIDKELPNDLKDLFGLSEDRKQLICKLIDKRISKLKEVLS